MIAGFKNHAATINNGSERRTLSRMHGTRKGNFSRSYLGYYYYMSYPFTRRNDCFHFCDGDNFTTVVFIIKLSQECNTGGGIGKK